MQLTDGYGPFQTVHVRRAGTTEEVVTDVVAVDMLLPAVQARFFENVQELATDLMGCTPADLVWTVDP